MWVDHTIKDRIKREDDYLPERQLEEAALSNPSPNREQPWRGIGA